MSGLVFVVQVGLAIYTSVGLGYMLGYRKGRRHKGAYIRRIVKDSLAISKIVQEELSKEN